MRQLLILATCLIVGVAAALADDMQKYKEFMDEVKAEVYSRDMPEFEVREVPEKYSGESAVILAIYEEIIAKKKTSFGFNSSMIGLGNNAKIHADRLMRMLVQINDKAALESYSEFDFSVRDKSDYYGYKSEDTRKALGARIIKPDGTVVEVNTDDYIDVLQGKKGQEKRQKLAVPGLEVGDKLDIFVYTTQKLQNMHLPPEVFVLKDDYPILDYKIHCELDDDLTTQYRTLNGAPDFSTSVDDNKNYILDLDVKDISGKNPRMWYNAAQQSPMILMHIFNRRANSYTYTPPSAKKDGMHANPDAALIQEDVWDFGLLAPRTIYPDWIKSYMKDGGKLKKELQKMYKDGKMSDQEFADYVYNLWVYAVTANRLRVRERDMMWMFYYLLSNAELPVHYGITTDEGNEPIDQLISYDDISWYVGLNDGSRYYFAPVGFIAPNEIPYIYQGRKAVPHRDKKERKKGGNAEFELPSSSPDDNVGTSSLTVAIDGTSLDISRREDAVGSAKFGMMRMLSEEDIVEGYAGYLNRHGLTVEAKEKKKEAADRAERYTDARKEQLEVAKSEVHAYHDEDASEVREFKVESIGIDPENPMMSYTVDYRMDNMVKRAGGNFVVPVGRLMSGQVEVLASDKERADDVYMIAPRCYVTKIELTLPQGYRVTQKSLDALKSKVDNDAGSFIAGAEVKDGKLVIEVTKLYKHKVEPASNWPDLLKVLEAASGWSAKTVLLEK